MTTTQITKSAFSLPAFGNLGRLAEYVSWAGAEFTARLRPGPGVSVLDIGPGLYVFDAARSGAAVTAVEPDPFQLESVRAYAGSLGREDIAMLNADPRSLPFEDGSFDIVMSLFGSMFTPRPDRVAAEMTRACRPGGTLAMANWTPDGLIAQMFRIVGRYAGPEDHSPFEWGRASWVRRCFGEAVDNLEFSRRNAPMSFPFPVAAVVDLWLTYYPPLCRIHASLQRDAQTDLRLDLEWLWSHHNLSAEEGSTLVDAEYLEVRANRRRERLICDARSISMELRDAAAALSGAV